MRVASGRDRAGGTGLLRLLLLGLLAVLSVGSLYAEPQRIVSTSPSITEDLFALGLGTHVVGVSNYCDYPEAVRALPRVGTFLRPDPELIARLKPDLVLVHKLPNDLTNRLRALHIPYAEVDRGGLEDSYTQIRQIGEAAGISARAEKLISDLRARLRNIREQADRQPPPRVIFIIGKEPGTLSNLVVVGHDAFLNDLIETAGGNNAMAKESAQPYPHISLETIFRIDPDMIIDMGDMGITAAERERKVRDNERLWKDLPRLRAVRNNRVYCLTDTAFVVPGPRAPAAAGILFSILQGRPLK